MAFAALLSVVVAVGSVVASEVAEFPGAQQQGQNISKEVLGQMLTSASSFRLANITEEIGHTFATLPKNAHGRLEPSTVRYALHRYFVQKRGWYVKGLDPEGDGWSASSSLPSDDIMKGQAPVYIQEYFSMRLHDSGLDINDLAVFIATVADLVFQENLGHLRRVYKKLGLSTLDPVEVPLFDMAMRACLADLIVGDFGKFERKRDFPALEVQAKDFYPEYGDHVSLLRSSYPTQDFPRIVALTPIGAAPLPGLKIKAVPFEVAMEFLNEFMRSFGTMVASECRTFKEDLVAMEQAGSGRVLLTDFFANSRLQLRESTEYLRNLGAYEEDAGPPRLIIPNLVNSPSRCTPFSSYSTVCCPDECSGLLGQLERHVGQPSPPLASIVEFVPVLPSQTVDAPRSLSTLLLTRLNDIANLHGGRVPLHARLFMQWMHHAYPRECPYPHIAGTTNPASQDDWMLQHPDIESVEPTAVERTRVTLRGSVKKSVQFEDLPWSNVEELVAVNAGDFNYRVEYLRSAFAFAALLTAGSSLAGLARLAFRAQPSSIKLMPLA